MVGIGRVGKPRGGFKCGWRALRVSKRGLGVLGVLGMMQGTGFQD